MANVKAADELARGFQKTASGRMGLEEFVYMLKALVTDYELIRSKLHALEKDVAVWKKIAGNLSDQLNSPR
jgi:hypothetical protein